MDLVLLGVACFLAAVILGGAIVLAGGGRRRVDPPGLGRGPAAPAHWVWRCARCQRVISPAAPFELPEHMVTCLECALALQAEYTRATEARSAARERRNGHVW